jgi:hypothetical protein
MTEPIILGNVEYCYTYLDMLFICFSGMIFGWMFRRIFLMITDKETYKAMQKETKDAIKKVKENIAVR